MKKNNIETPGVQKAVVNLPAGWELTHHQLFDVSPNEVGKFHVVGGDMSIWDLCFLEDLLQARNVGREILLDVGWYPHADPSGEYRLLVMPAVFDSKNNKLISCDWDKTSTDYSTKSLSDLLEKLKSI